MTAQYAEPIQMVISLPFGLLERTEQLVQRGLTRDWDSLLPVIMAREVVE